MVIRQSSVPGVRWRLAAVALSAGALFGFAIAVINDALQFVVVQFSLSSVVSGIVVSGVAAGALVGCLTAGTLADSIGRRAVLIGAGVAAAVGTAASAFATDVWVLIAGRVLLGVAVGITTAVAPLYLAELAPPALRGGLITTYQLSVTLGILLALATGVALTPTENWRAMLAIGLLPAVCQVAALCTVPRSPRYLVRRGHADQARRALRRLRPPDEVEEELAQIAVSHGDPTRTPARDMFGARYRPALIVGLAAALLNAFCGVGAVIYYSTEVFTIAGVQGTTGAELASLAVGGMNTAAAVAAVVLVNRHGRRPLLSVGLGGIIGSLVVAGAALMAPESSATGIVTVIAILVYMAFFAISAGPLAWLLVAEVFPSRIRAQGAGLATASNWGANLLIALLFPVVAGVPAAPANVAIIFWFFAACSLGFLVFVRRRVPETKDRTLEQIEQDLHSRSISGSLV